MRHYCTLFDANYLARGLCLYRSMEPWCGEFQLHVLALDQETLDRVVAYDLAVPRLDVTALHWVSDERLNLARSDRTRQEFAWTCASWWLRFCVERWGDCTYLDADSCFYNSPEPVFAEIGAAPGAVTPHRFAPAHEHFAKNGRYNVNFVYATEKGLPFLREWEGLCLDWCKYEWDNGRMGDQLYLDALVPKYGLHEIQTPTCNLAPWNQLQYSYAERGGQLYVAGVPVVLYHLHELVHAPDGRITRRTGWELHPMLEYLYRPYEALLREVCAELTGDQLVAGASLMAEVRV